MIGVAFVNEIVFWIIGLIIGWFFGKQYEKARQWLVRKKLL
jgi:hypothetical protein